MRILITGASGFAGQHLIHHLRESRGNTICGLLRHAKNYKEKLSLDLSIEGDLTCREDVLQLVRKARPDRIYHFAGQSFIPAMSFNPEEVFRVNVLGAWNLLEAVRQMRLNPKILIAGSSEVYGRVALRDLPIQESAPLAPVNFYGVSKASQELMARQFAFSGDLKVICTRAFNHIGPGQNARFSISGFARQIALIEEGRAPAEIVVGNLKAVRDFTDVRDTVRGYRLAIEEAGRTEVYNIGSGKGYAIREILDRLLRLSRVKAKIRVDKTRLRPADIPAHVADVRLFRRATGWKPQIPLTKTLTDILDYWRNQIASE